MANLLERASIVLTPTASNTSEVLCVKPSDATGDFDFLRATDATRINSLGLIETNAINLPRINYEGGCGSWLFEPQSTNLITYSETLGNNTTSGGISFTYNNSISPDGTQNAALVSVTSANDRLQPSFAAVNSLVAISIFLKHDGTDFTTQINTFNTGDSTLFGATCFVTSTGVTFTSYQGGFDSASFVDYGNGWFRVIVVCQSTTGTTFAQWRPTTVSVALSYPCFGFQVEVQDFATSYIKTDSGSTVTRNQDLCNNGGSLSSINSTEGTLYFEGSGLFDGGSSRHVSLSDVTNNNIVQFRYDTTAGRITSYMRGNGGSYAIKTILGFTQTNNNKIALVWNATNLRIWINGTESGSIATNDLPIGMDTLSITAPTGSNIFFGNTKCLAVWKEALTDAELTALTTI
jgi:hypothetical protein